MLFARSEMHLTLLMKVCRKRFAFDLRGEK